jgi:hypothetical protein
VQTIRRISSCFLRIFDTQPLYSPEDLADPRRMQTLLMAKRLAGLTLQTGAINGVTTAQFLARVRRR